VRSAEERKGHVGSEEYRAHEILADAGRMRPRYSFGASTSRRGRWSHRRRPTRRKPAGMARSQSFLPPLIPGPAHDWVR